MQITIFGASGKVGRLVVAEALRRGYNVRAVVHRDNVLSPNTHLTIVEADVYNADDIAMALQDSEAVISCLGSWGRKTAAGNRNVLTAAMKLIIPAMKNAKIRRIVTLTGSGAADPNVRPGLVHTLVMKVLQPFPAGRVFKDGELHMQLLKNSDLDWTTVRSPVMSDRGGPRYKLSMKASLHFITASRSSVATSMLDQLESTEWLRRAPIITRVA